MLAEVLEELAAPPVEDPQRVQMPARLGAWSPGRGAQLGDLRQGRGIAVVQLLAADPEGVEAPQLARPQRREDVREPVVEPEGLDLPVPRPGSGWRSWSGSRTRPMVRKVRARASSSASALTTAPPSAVVMFFVGKKDSVVTSESDPTGMPSRLPPRACAASSRTAAPTSRRPRAAPARRSGGRRSRPGDDPDLLVKDRVDRVGVEVAGVR